MKNWDVVIAGAGLAGLSMAVELAAPEFSHLRILIVEPRTEYVRDRTWSFWALPDALPERWRQLAQTQWRQWRVSYAERSVESSGEVAYASIRADTFYNDALKIIANASHIEWRRGTGVVDVKEHIEGVELLTTQGDRYVAKLLLDSRPPAAAQASEWVQHFSGWEITSRSPCFDAACLDLMAFEPSEQGLHFIYCLPYSATQALVESTWISRADASVNGDAELRDALATRWHCHDFEISFREQGALPLWPSFLPELKQVVRIGRAGGTLRASTGYAFCATLHHATSLARSLSIQINQHGHLQGWQAPEWRTGALDRWMDTVLFRVLERDWKAAPHLFVDLFERVPSAPLTRFLHGQSRWLDRWAVMRALPASPFIRAALRWE